MCYYYYCCCDCVFFFFFLLLDTLPFLHEESWGKFGLVFQMAKWKECFQLRYSKLGFVNHFRVMQSFLQPNLLVWWILYGCWIWKRLKKCVNWVANQENEIQFLFIFIVMLFLCFCFLLFFYFLSYNNWRSFMASFRR